MFHKFDARSIKLLNSAIFRTKRFVFEFLVFDAAASSFHKQPKIQNVSASTPQNLIFCST
jgi:hypothetical protein